MKKEQSKTALPCIPQVPRFLAFKKLLCNFKLSNSTLTVIFNQDSWDSGFLGFFKPLFGFSKWKLGSKDLK